MEENTEHQTLQAEFDTSPEPLAQPDTTPNHQCPKCQRVFTSEPALRMHHIRKHSGKGWSTAANFKGKRGKTWRAGQLEKFRATMKRRATMKEKVKVFTDTRNNQEPGNNPGVNNPVVTFCPRCGCNIRNVAAAIAFGDKHQ